MIYYMDSTRLAISKKLILESKENKKKSYVYHDFWGDHFHGYYEDFLDYMEDLQESGLFKLVNLHFSKSYIDLQPKRAAIFASYADFSTPTHVDHTYRLGRNIYKKVIKEEALTLDEIKEIKEKLGNSRSQDFYSYFTFGINFPDSARKLQTILRNYIQAFKEGEMVAHGTARYFSFDVQRAAFLRTIGRLAIFYGPRT